MSRTQIITKEEAAKLIKDNSQIGFPSMGLAGNPEEVISGIEQRFKKENHPKDLSVIVASGVGNFQEGRGLDYFAHDGMTKRIIGGHILHSPLMNKKIVGNEVEAYLFPQGTIAHLYRAIAGGRPGVISKTGLYTFVDPRIDGGKVNERTTEDLINLVEIDGEEWMNFKSFPIDVAIIRGTYSDSKGNISNDREVADLESLPLAQAAKNSGGIVIAQVQGIVQDGSIKARDVAVPGAFVDYVVVSEEPKLHTQTAGELYSPALSNEIKVPVDSLEPLPFGVRKILGRRAAMELPKDSVVNLGVGIPDGISNIAKEEGILDNLTLTLELGPIGGTAQPGLSFGASINADAIIKHQEMFDFYDGGGLDLSILGLAQTDEQGNINVSKFGSRVVGPGGFINIASATKRIVFVGTFNRGSDIEVVDGEVKITDNGKGKKFLKEVEQICFSGQFAQETGQEILYVTERGVFDLHEGRMRLIEIAPGIDLEEDILAWMDFEPLISEDLKEMPAGIFKEDWGELKTIIESN